MARIRHLSKAPVTEALIDFQITPSESVWTEALEQALLPSAFGYAKKGPIVQGNFGFSLDVTASPMAQALPGTTVVKGARLHSLDEKYVAQFRTDGFTLSRLEPYEDWERLIAETKRLWSVYRQWINPTGITRAATRYINNLRLPLQQGDRFERFFTGLPNFPAEVPQSIGSFLQRFVIQDPKCGATVILTQGLEGTHTGEPVPVILDIDVFKEVSFPVDNDKVWNYLEELRSVKNTFFFAMLTEEIMEIYK